MLFKAKKSLDQMLMFTAIFIFLFVNLADSSPQIKGPPVVEVRETKMIVRKDQDVKIVCPISGVPPPIFEWTKDKEVINNYSWQRFRVTKKSMKITKATLDDTGIYVCKGTNGFGWQDSRINLIVIDPQDYPDLSPSEDPFMAAPVLTEVTLSPRSAYRKESGETFSLVCEALGEPDPDVMWFKDNVIINHGKTYSIDRQSKSRVELSINRLSKSESGLYTCSARNTAGEVSRNFTLDVIGDDDEFIGHPVMLSGPENTTIEQGDQAVLECKVQSSTLPNIKWLKRLDSKENDQSKDIIDIGSEKFRVISHQNEYQIINEKEVTGRDEYLSKMLIHTTTEYDAGMYICFVKNPVSYTFRNAYLTIAPKPITPIEGVEISPMLILVICLAVVVLLLLVGTVICVLKRKQKDACANSTLSESPEVRENLMRNYQHNQGQSLYHQQILAQGQQTYMYQHLQQPQQLKNNNVRSTLGQMNIVVNKLDKPLPPPPPAAPTLPPPGPPSSVQPYMMSLYHSRPTSTSRLSNENPNSQVGNHCNYNGQQNQYEVPHVVRYGQQVYNEVPYPYGRSTVVQHLQY